MSRAKTSPGRLAAALALALTACLVAACGSSAEPGGQIVTETITQSPSDPGTSSAGTPSSTTPTHTKPKIPAKTVHVTSLIGDGEVYGIAMPIILYFSPVPTDSHAFTEAVTVTVNGTPAKGAWYWEQPLASEKKKHIIEAHYRMKVPWPANSTVQVKLPIKGLSAGKGLAYSGKLNSVTFRTGDAHITTVDGNSKQMVVTSNGKEVKKIPVSLGKAKTPTYNGKKVVMQKGEDYPGTNKKKPKGTVQMKGPGYNEPVQWSVRLTNSGEYIHAAPWNSHIGQLSTSNGCTNLSVAAAKWFYKFSRVGDLVIYSNTDGGRMPSWDGYGGWNLNWHIWERGGKLLNP